MDNEISKSGSHSIQLWREPTLGTKQVGYWGGYTHKGHVMRMNSPKRGQVVEMPRGHLYKIVAIGTVNLPLQKGQEPAVFLKEWKQ